MIFSLVAMTGLEKCCITSAYLLWLCHSGERPVAHGPLVFFFVFFWKRQKACIAYSLFFFLFFFFFYFSPFNSKKLLSHRLLEVGLKRIIIKKNIKTERNRYKTKTTGASLESRIRTIKTFLMLISAEHVQLNWTWKKSFKNCQYFQIYKQNKFHAQLSWAWNLSC